MNRDDIIRMAWQCGLTINDEPMLGVEHFAKLVAAVEREACMRDQESLVEFNSLLAKHHVSLVEQQKSEPWPAKEVIDKAVAAEREACAKMCEAYMAEGIGREMARAIRARGE